MLIVFCLITSHQAQILVFLQTWILLLFYMASKYYFSSALGSHIQPEGWTSMQSSEWVCLWVSGCMCLSMGEHSWDPVTLSGNPWPSWTGSKCLGTELWAFTQFVFWQTHNWKWEASMTTLSGLSGWNLHRHLFCARDPQKFLLQFLGRWPYLGAICELSERTKWKKVASLAQTVKRLSTMWETRVQSLGWEDPLEKEMAIHSSTIGWKIPWTEEPQRVGHDWASFVS